MFKNKKLILIVSGILSFAMLVGSFTIPPVTYAQENVNIYSEEIDVMDLLEGGLIDELTPNPFETEDLEQDGNGDFIYISEYIEVIIPEESDEMISLSGYEDREDIVMGIATSSDVEGILIDDSIVFYEDEDFGVGIEVFDGGVRQTFIIESSDAPTYFVVEFDLPEGGRLEFAYDAQGYTDGSILLYASDEEFDSFGATDVPWARDVNGEMVSTHFEIDGNRLIQHVYHSDEFTYPIVADPTTFSTYFTGGRWQTRGNERSLSITPRLRLRTAGAGTWVSSLARIASTAIVIDSWRTVVNRYRGQDQWRNNSRTNTTMWNQYVCHFYLVWWRPGSWNLEPRRDNVSLANTVRAGCNPTYRTTNR